MHPVLYTARIQCCITARIQRVVTRGRAFCCYNHPASYEGGFCACAGLKERPEWPQGRSAQVAAETKVRHTASWCPQFLSLAYLSLGTDQAQDWCSAALQLGHHVCVCVCPCVQAGCMPMPKMNCLMSGKCKWPHSHPQTNSQQTTCPGLHSTILARVDCAKPVRSWSASCMPKTAWHAGYTILPARCLRLRECAGKREEAQAGG